MKPKENKIVNIAIDALGINEVGGARSVTIPLLKKVFEQKENWNFFCFLTAYEQDLDYENVKQIILPLSKGLLSRLIFQIYLPFFILINRIDLTHFIKSQGSFVCFTKKIITIYDCTILKYPYYFNFASRFFWQYLQPLMIKTMDHVITISHDARNEISKQLGVSLEKISVVYPAPQFDNEKSNLEEDDEKILKKFNLQGEYLLFIGQIGKKKNLTTLIKAYEILNKESLSAPPLILVGPRYYLSDAGEVFETINRFNLNEEIIYLGAVEKNELKIILKNAMILLFPSIHEGFGIPLVEAMQFGIPVISSNTSVMPEVLDNSGVTVDDFLSPEAWAEKIKFLINNPELRRKYSLKGKERSKSFSWDLSAKELIRVYEELIERIETK